MNTQKSNMIFNSGDEEKKNNKNLNIKLCIFLLFFDGFYETLSRVHCLKHLKSLLIMRTMFKERNLKRLLNTNRHSQRLYK